jgi:hypothetical protein
MYYYFYSKALNLFADAITSFTHSFGYYPNRLLFSRICIG